MPVYSYEHPRTGETIDIVQSMDEQHVYVDELGVQWSRIFSPCQLNTTGRIDPWDKNSFMNTTGDSKGSLGDIMDRSKEMSDARAEQCGGEDPVKKKFYRNYAKRRNGAKHPNDPNK